MGSTGPRPRALRGSLVGQPRRPHVHALAASTRILRATLDWPQAEAFARQEEISGPVFASEDAREGATAFAEKRPPVWRAR